MTSSRTSATATLGLSSLATRLTGFRATARSAAAVPDSVWVPLVSAALVLAAGALSLATGHPWLFAALGPSAVSVAATPGHPTNRFHNIVVGHVAALVCGFLAVALVGAGDAPFLLVAKTLPVTRVWASAIAVAATVFAQSPLRAFHPPAAATALLVALGAYRMTWTTSLSLVGGILLVALLGEWFQRLRLTPRSSSARGRRA